MSCIVGIKDKERVILGGDSAITTSSTIQPDQCPKIFSIQSQQGDEYLIGHAGSGRVGNVLRHIFIPPPFKVHADALSVEKYMVTHFVDALRKALKQAGFAQTEKDAE